jgi:hypothetical protein
MLIFAKALPKQPFQRIPFHRRWYLFSCYRKPEARAYTRISTYQDRDTGVTTSNIVLKNLLKIDRAR